MAALKRVLRKIYQLLFWLVFRLRIYFLWSKIYRWLFERKHRYQAIPLFYTLESLEVEIGRMQWRPDNWRMLWDVISLPNAVWARHAAGLPAGDCDDISIAAAAAFLKNFSMRIYNDFTFTEPLMMSVVWQDGWKLTGHNVCIISYSHNNKSCWAHWSNWNSGRIQWNFESIESIAASINPNYVGFAVWKPDLTEILVIKFS